VVIQSKLFMVNIDESEKPIWMISKSGRYFSIDTWDALRKKKKKEFVDW
jgi:hypothetical protein